MYTFQIRALRSGLVSYAHAFLYWNFGVIAFSCLLLAYYFIDRHRPILVTTFWNAPLSWNNYLLIRSLCFRNTEYISQSYSIHWCTILVSIWFDISLQERKYCNRLPISISNLIIFITLNDFLSFYHSDSGKFWFEIICQLHYY